MEEGRITLKYAFLDQSPIALEPQELHITVDLPPKCQGFFL